MMRWPRGCVLGFFLASIPAGAVQASEPAREAGGAKASAVRAAAAAKDRAWLRERLVRGLQSPQQIQALDAELARLPDEKIQELMGAYLEQAARRDAESMARLREELARAREGHHPARPGGHMHHGPWPGAVGYFPVITWLPAGASLTACAVVSPDGRYVRTTLFPFFSWIGPVETFNFVTGETRPWPPRDGHGAPAGAGKGARHGPRPRADRRPQ